MDMSGVMPPQGQVHQPAQHKPKKGRGMPFHRLASAVILISVAMLVLAVTALFVFNDPQPNEEDAIMLDRYQTVFLDDVSGQIYIGNLRVLNDDYYVLTNAFLVQAGQIPAPEGNTTQQQVSLSPVKSQVHGPEDALYIAKDKVLFWENLKDDGKAAEAIKNNKTN